MFGSINTDIVEYFHKHYAALSEAAAAATTVAVVVVGIGVGRAFQYRDFDNKKPLTFD